MVNSKLVLVAAALSASLGVTAAFADASALGQLPGAKEAIMSYYAANAREQSCDAGHMTDIGGAKLVNQSGDTATVAVDYSFSATPGAGGTECTGQGSREFTLTKTGSGWSVSAMTGQAP